jgi:adenylate cyclase
MEVQPCPCHLRPVISAVSETRKIAAILVSDVVGYSRLTGADEDRILARLRALRSDLIDPTISVHHGRVVKRTGDGAIVEFRSVVDAVNCAIDVVQAYQRSSMLERRRPVMSEWANFVCGESDSNVVPLRRGAASE